MILIDIVYFGGMNIYEHLYQLYPVIFQQPSTKGRQVSNHSHTQVPVMKVQKRSTGLMADIVMNKTDGMETAAGSGIGELVVS